MFKNVFYIGIFVIISWGSYLISYPSSTPKDLFYEGLFFENIQKHIDKLTKGPRAVGDYYHQNAQRYVIQQLNSLGLKVSIQKSIGFNLGNQTAAPVRNIIATKPGSNPDGKALMLLAHYDAAKFSAKGAADDASGVAIILETLKSLLINNPQLNNDLVVLITDAEELGLLGAKAFINEQLSHHEIGLIINLEARGSAGPSMMWPETVGGNRAMIEAFAKANVPMPVTTSLHYEIYKLLPNDTDLTPFNKISKINGFNFAFIDDHFNYHTQLDSLENLSLDTLAHQTIQFNSMIKYFSQADLSNLKSTDSLVYFSLPLIGIISYPPLFNWLMLTTVALLLIWVAFKYRQQDLLSVGSISLGLLAVSGVVFVGFIWSWLVIKSIYLIQPILNDILHGFPYTGHAIMLCLLISSAFLVTALFTKVYKKLNQNGSIAVILLWLILLTPLLYFLPGSGFLIIPLILSSGLLTLQIYQPKIAHSLAIVFASAAFILMGVLLINFPIALGVKAIPVTTVILSLMLALFPQILIENTKFKYSMMMTLAPLVLLFGYLIQNPNNTNKHPHPTSLSYLYDQDKKAGYFFNYDEINSGWSDYLFNQPLSKNDIKSFRKKYHKPLKQLAASEDNMPIDPIVITAHEPLNSSANKKINVKLKANSDSEILEIYTNKDLKIHFLGIDNRHANIEKAIHFKAGDRILQYVFNGKKEIQLTLEIENEQNLNWQVQTHSMNLLNKFEIIGRPNHQIPKPFIKSDNIVSVQSFSFGSD